MVTRRQALKSLALGSALLNQHLLERIALGETAATPASKAMDGQPAQGVIVRQMLMQPLAALGNHVAAMMVVEYAPGAASPSDLHPRLVFGYVLQGSVEIETEKHHPITYSEGDLWCEAPSMSRNASTTEPAKVITFLIAEKDRALEPARVSS